MSWKQERRPNQFFISLLMKTRMRILYVITVTFDLLETVCLCLPFSALTCYSFLNFCRKKTFRNLKIKKKLECSRVFIREAEKKRCKHNSSCFVSSPIFRIIFLDSDL